MRISRRTALIAGGGALAGIGLSLSAGRRRRLDARVPVAVEARALDRFSRPEPERRRFGALTFRSGLELRSHDDRFGGYSGLWRSADGGRLLAVSDAGTWLGADLVREGRRLAGLRDAWMAPVLGPEGPLRRRFADAEALAAGDGALYLAFERAQRVLRFGWTGAAVEGRGEPVAVPPEVEALPANKGLEALAVAPRSGPLAGALVAVSERARWGDDAPTRGFILTGPLRGAFDLARSDGYDATDLAFLGGDALLLERRYAVLLGPAVRLRLLKASAIRPGARVDGPVIFEAGTECEIDNMEGLALHRDPDGATVLTLMSDDNFSPLQRTLLLEFTLDL